MTSSHQQPEQTSPAHVGDADFALVLDTENKAAYQRLRAGLVSELRPVDQLEHILVRDIAHATWEMMRFARHKALAIEICYYEEQKGRVQKLLNTLARNKRTNFAARPTAMRVDVSYVLERATEYWLRLLRDKIRRLPDEADYVRSQGICMPYYNWLESGFSAAARDRDRALMLLAAARNVSSSAA